MSMQHPRNLAEWQKAVERALKANKSGVQVAITHATDEAQAVRDEVGGYLILQAAAPVELVAQTSTYIDVRGFHRGRVTIGFPAVTMSTTAEPITVSNYQLAAQAHDSSWNPTEPNYNIVATSDGPSLMAMDFTPGSKWKFKVRASAGNFTIPGVWSAELQVTIVSDTTPPPQPSTPVGSVVLATMKVAWDGKAAGGGLMPADLDRVELAFGLASSPTTIIDTYYSADPTYTMVPKSAYNVPHYFRLRAVDTSGNIGAWSAQISLTPVPLVDVDLILSHIDAAVTEITNIGNASILNGAINSAKLADNAVSQAKLQDQIISLAKLDTTVDTKIQKGIDDASAADGKAVLAQTAAAKAKLIADTAVSQAQNTVPDSTFDLGLERWDQQATNPANVAVIADATAHRGTNVLEMTAYTTNTLVQVASDYFQPVTPGQIWEVSAWVRVNGTLPTTGDIRIACVTKSDTGVLAYPAQVTVPSTSLTNTIQRISAYYTVPAGIAGLAFRMRMDGTTTGGAKVQWSDVAMRDVTMAKSAIDAAAAAQAAANQAITDAATAQTSANGKNTITNSTADATSGVPGKTSGDRWQKWTSLGTGGKLLDSWRWNGSAWIAEAMDPTYIPLLDIGAGTFGSLDGARISAGTIEAKHLIVTDFTNMIPGAQMQNGTLGWTTSNATLSVVTTSLGLPGLKVTKTTTNEADAYAPWVDCMPGDMVRVSFTTEGNWDSGNANIYAQKMDVNGVVTSFTTNVPNVSTPGNKSGVVQMPADAVRVRFRPYVSNGASAGTYAIFSNMWARRMNAGELTVDGTVTATAIATNAVTAKQLLVGDFQNLAIGADFEDATAVPFALDARHTITTSQKKFGTSSLRLGAGTGTASSLFTNDARVKEGEQWYIKFWAYIDASFNGTSGNSKIRAGNATTGGTFITAASFDAGTIARSTWVPLETTVTVPAGCLSLKVEILSDNTAGTAYIDDVQIRRVSEASLIMNLGVEKLVATSASMGQAVIDKLWTDVVRSRRMTTDMLAVGRGVNGIVDEFFDSADTKAFRNTTSGGWGAWAVSGTTDLNMYTQGSLTAGTSRSFYFDTIASYDKTTYIPVEPGQIWRLSAQYTSAVSGPRATIRLIKRDGTTQYTSVGWEKRDGTANVYDPAGTVRTLERVYEVPADVTHVMPAVQFESTCTSATVYGGATFTNMATSSLIVDGAIAARNLTVTDEMWTKILHFKQLGGDEIDVNDLTADTAWIGTMRGGILINDAVDTGQLKATAITSKHTITGATFQTVTTANRGIKINAANGFRQYDSTGNLLVDIGGSSGPNMIVGDMMTSRPGTGGVRLINSSEWGLPAIIYSYNGNQTVQEAASFMRYTIDGDPELVHRAPNRAIVGGTGLGFVRVEGDLILSLGNGASGAQQMRVEQPFNLDAWSPVDGYHAMTLNGKLTTINAVAGNLKLDAGSYYVQLPSTYGKTTGTSGNVVIASDGGLFRSTSASKYKILPDALLDVDVKNWIDLAAAEEFNSFYEKPVEEWEEWEHDRFDAISLKRIPGAIAEDVVAAGGDDFVVYGVDGQVEGLMYDRLALAQIKLLQKRGEVLAETLVSVLERLDALEA